MLNPKAFLKKDLDEAVRLHDQTDYHIRQVDTLTGRGSFTEAQQRLRLAIALLGRLEDLKDDKLLDDMAKILSVAEENDRQGIVDKVLSKWRR